MATTGREDLDRPPPVSVGPGDYDPQKVEKAAPAAVITGRPRPLADESDDLPGPGEYSPDLGPAGPAFTMGTRIAPPGAKAGAELPAPGEYEAAPLPRGPAFTLAPRIDPRPLSSGESVQGTTLTCLDLSRLHVTVTQHHSAASQKCIWT